MEITFTLHAINEFKKHLKLKGSNEIIINILTRYFFLRPKLIQAKSYTLPRKGKSPKSRGRNLYLVRLSWKYSKYILLLKEYENGYIALTCYSGHEFRSMVKRNLIQILSERESLEKYIFKYNTISYS